MVRNWVVRVRNLFEEHMGVAYGKALGWGRSLGHTFTVFTL